MRSFQRLCVIQQNLMKNDEITFKSLKEITNMNISDSKIIRGLDKELGAGLYDQSEAFFKIDAFNTQNKFKKEVLSHCAFNFFWEICCICSAQYYNKQGSFK